MYRSLVIAAGLIAAIATHLLHRRLDEIVLLEPSVELETLPSIQSLKIVGLTYESVIADYYWLRALEHFGTSTYGAKGFPLLEPMLQRTLALDPYFKSAYTFAGTALTLRGMDPRNADAILEKGLQYRPDVWQIPFFLGFNLYYFEENYARAAEVLSLAAEHKEAPPYTAQLATRIAARAGKPEFGIQLIDSILERTNDEQIRESYMERRKRLLLEVEVNYLNTLVQRYRAEKGQLPARIDDFVTAGYLREKPFDPYGKPYEIDAYKRVLSESESARLRMDKGAESDRAATGWHPPLQEDKLPFE